MEKFELFDCSPKAQAKIKPDAFNVGNEAEISTKTTRNNGKYPWHEMQVGKCFILPIDSAKEISLRNCASQHSRLKKKFIVIKHADLKIFEVARIA